MEQRSAAAAVRPRFEGSGSSPEDSAPVGTLDTSEAGKVAALG